MSISEHARIASSGTHAASEQIIPTNPLEINVVSRKQSRVSNRNRKMKSDRKLSWTFSKKERGKEPGEIADLFSSTFGANVSQAACDVAK